MQQPSIVPSGSAGSSSEPVAFKFKLDCDNAQQFIERYAADVSRGRIVIRTMKPHPVGTHLKMELQCRNGTSLIIGDGKVFWTREPDAASGPFPGMGIRLGKLTRASQDLINQTLAYREQHERSTGHSLPT